MRRGLQALPRAEQARLVVEAQSFEPVQPSPAPPADADPLPAFLRQEAR